MPSKNARAASRAPSNGRTYRDGHPLSAGQKALFFLERLARGTGAYHIAAAARVSPRLDRPSLERTLRRLVVRHPLLGAAVRGAEDLHWIASQEPVDLFEVDATLHDEKSLTGELVRIAEHPFELGRGPLLRVVVLRRAVGDVLLLVVHHLVADFWSLAVLTRELGTLYGQETGAAERSELPVLEADFAAYVAWQERWLASPEAAAQEEGWRRQLVGSPVLELPTDRPRPPQQTFRGLGCSRHLTAERSRCLARLARSRGTTLMVLVLAAFKALLYRFSEERDLAVGTPTAGRRRGPWSGVVGYFVNPVVVRTRLSGRDSFTELLAAVKASSTFAFAHQDLPFPVLAERLQPRRDPARPPLFQVDFVYQKARRGQDASLTAFALGVPGVPLELGGARFESLALPESGARSELTLRAAEVDGRLTLDLQVNRELFDLTTARRLLAQLDRLLATVFEDAVLENVERSVDELPLIGPVEAHQLLVETRTAGPPSDCSLYELFAERATLQPDAVAVVEGAARLSYGELATRSHRLALGLAHHGVEEGGETVVAISLGRTASLLVAVLGVLRSGGAFVPIEAGLPRERRAFLLADSGARLLFGAEAMDGATLLDPDVLAASVSAERPLPGVDARSLAYVIYTSGSTGRPKGVAIPHRAVVALVAWAQEAFSAREMAGVLAATSISFDLSIFELFATLAAGGKVILARDVLALPGLPAQAEVTLVNTVPSALKALLDLTALSPSTRAVNLAGEALAPSLVAMLAALAPWTRVLNLYGPSEDATYSTAAQVAADGRPQAAIAGERSSIGRPLPGTTALVTDRRLRPVPFGVPGELVLGGAGLARGYHRRPAVTAERFVPDPFSDDGFGDRGERLYRTGDRARTLGDGSLDILGRLDRQIKLRGFRVELGEIEAVLGEHPAVREAAVLTQDDAAVGTRLVAWVAPVVETRQLERFLADRLPSYMWPSQIACRDALPRLASGKVDRQALAAAVVGEKPRAAGRGPEGVVEELVAGAFSELLGTTAVGAGDDFFALGGHSLLVPRLADRLAELCAVELPIASVLASPTVEGLAAVIEERRGDVASSAPPLASTRRRPGDLVTPSFAQQRLWFLDQLAGTRLAYNMPLALRLDGPLDVPSLALTLGEIERRHAVLRLRFANADEATIAASRRWLPIARVDLRGLEETACEDELTRRLGEDAWRPFDLRRGPLLTATLFRLAATSRVLLLRLHHIACDGWSLGILARELEGLYGAFASGRSSPLGEPALQVADVAVWERRFWEAGGLAEEMAWWRGQLTDMPPGPTLQTDRPWGVVEAGAGHQGASLVTVLDQRTIEALDGIARRAGATPFMLLLGAFAMLLGRQGQAREVVLGMPVAGRRRETGSLIGCFVNTLVLRLELDGASFAAFLGGVRRAVLDALAHQAVPFEKLVEELAGRLRPGKLLPAGEVLTPPTPLSMAGEGGGRISGSPSPAMERGLGGEEKLGSSLSPFFQVLFAAQPERPESLELPGLTTAHVPLDSVAARLDLTVAPRFTAAGTVEVWWEYRRDLFDRTTVERLGAGLEALLTAIVEDPERCLDELPALALGARRQLVVEEASPAPGVPAASRETVELIGGLFARLLGARLLGRGTVEPEADFFALGGHSLLAARLVAELRESFAVELPIEAVFAAPTPAGLARRVEEGLRDAPAAPAPALTPLPDAERFSVHGWPLSPSQERLWFLQRFDPQLTAYNLHAALRLDGALDHRCLTRAFERVVRRHDALRTTFSVASWDDGPRVEGVKAGEPVQVVAPPGDRPPELPAVDLSALADVDRERAFARVVRQLVDRSFELDAPPLWRALTLRFADERHVFFFVLHHILGDGWSLQVLLRDLAAFYRGAAPQALALQVVDWARWQRAFAVDDAAALAFWKERLTPPPGVLELPTDRPRPAVQSYAGASWPLVVPGARREALAELARQDGATLFMTVLASFQILLWRYSRRRDVAIGAPVAGRDLASTGDVMGFFVNTLVLRDQVKPGETWRERLRAARREALKAFAHQSLPFEKLVAELRPARDTSHTPFVQVMLAWQHLDAEDLAWPGLDIRLLELEGTTAMFDLTLSLIDRGDELRGALNYSSTLFDATTAGRFVAQLETLWRALLAPGGAERPLRGLSLLSPAEEQQLCREWNESGDGPELDGCLHELVMAQARVRPAAIALQAGDALVSFGELDRRASWVAEGLRRCGVEVETPVGVLLPRGLEIMVAILGVFESGGTVVPLDPAMPLKRLEMIAEDAHLAVILTSRAVPGGAAGPPRSGRPRRSLRTRATPQFTPPSDLDEPVSHARAPLSDSLRSVEGAQPPAAPQPLRGGEGWADTGERPLDGPARILVEELVGSGPRRRDPRRVGPQHLAYTIYTSGSTGRPKGVMVPHGPAAAHMWNVIAVFGLTAWDKAFETAPFHFDAAFEGAFSVLGCGARLILPDGELWPANELRDLMKAERATTANFAPAYWQLWIEAHAEPSPGPWFRMAAAGGEAMPMSAVRRWLASALGECRLVNVYGPTEAVIFATSHEVTRWDLSWPSVSIGRPLAGRTQRVVEPGGTPAPIGVVGELLLDDPYLARGYLGRPRLTAELFVPATFLAEPGARSYKTGDLARYRVTGELDFLGRRDHQIKLRGFRIELGEIEAALMRQDGVAQAAVVLSSIGDDPRLVAFLVMAQDGAAARPSFSELRHALAAELPEYMLPADVRVLDELPLTTNSKVDRGALDALAASAPTGSLRAPTTPPRNPLERSIAEIWRQVLGQDGHGIDDSFFEVGGHSLSVVRLQGALEHRFGRRVPVVELFRRSTIRAQAELLRPAPSRPRPMAERPRRVDPALDADADADVAERIARVRRRRGGAPVPSWPGAARERGRAAPLTPSKAQDASTLRRALLPNGLEVAYQSKAELLQFYDDIFVKEIYWRHGLSLPRGAQVVDVGANIGLFSLFIARKVVGARILACEPAPPLHPVLRANVAACGAAVEVLPYALGVARGDRQLTFYPQSSGLSSLFADPEEERRLLKTLLRNQPGLDEAQRQALLREEEAFLAARLASQSWTVPVRTLSEVLREGGVERVDLLKIDAEKSEAEILAGIAEEDWSKIAQVVVEVHDVDGRLARLERELRARGFAVASEQETLYQGSDHHHLYARRPRTSASRSAALRPGTSRAGLSRPGSARLRRAVERGRAMAGDGHDAGGEG